MAENRTSFGKAFFIVNREFDVENSESAQRESAEKDYEYMQKSFLEEGMGFTLQNTEAYFKHNVTCNRWDHTKRHGRKQSSPKDCCLKCHIQSLDYSSSQCFMLAVSSHGKQIDDDPMIILSDGERLYLSEILDTISDQNCPSLRGKIKLLVIQTCRTGDRDQPDSEKNDDGVAVSVISAGSGRGSNPGATQRTDQPTWRSVDLTNVPEDIIIVFPTAAGKKSKRNTETGSWMLEEFSNVMARSRTENPGVKINFLKIVTVVSRCISMRETRSVSPIQRGKKNTVCTYHRLTQPFMFEFHQIEREDTMESDTDLSDFSTKKRKKRRPKDTPALLL